jgi:hypothetical protein
MNETRKEIKNMIVNKEWKTKEFSELKRGLANKLEVQDDTVESTEVSSQALKEIHVQ